MRGDVTAAIRAANTDGRAALVIYLPAGYPDLETSRACLEAAAGAGADLLEVGFPYSDPLMDGPTIQAANQVALDAGCTPDDDFAVCAQLTAAVDVPTLVMTYYNLAWHYPGPGQEGRATAGSSRADGLDDFAAACRAAGLAGAILPDLPAEEGARWRKAAAGGDLDTVFLAAPTSRDHRLQAVADASTGFVYATSTLGVTGERQSLSVMAGPLVTRLRDVTDLPVCVGIGVTTGAHAAEVAGFADGVIVGSAAVRAAGEGGPEAVAALVRELADGCRRSASVA
ncbi:MAG: tryptophan synthase subunit alpha [Egibacteraceae bacterium]